MQRIYPESGRAVQLLRGGSWNNNPRNCRSAYRNHNQPDNTRPTTPTPTPTPDSVWSASPNTLRRLNRWKGFPLAHRKGPDPLP
jgi:hypothetical protein